MLNSNLSMLSSTRDTRTLGSPPETTPLLDRLVRAAGVLFVALALVTAIGCGDRESPGEQAAEAIEEAADDVGDALD